MVQDMLIKFVVVVAIEAGIFFFMNWLSVYVPKEDEVFIQTNNEKIIEEGEEPNVIKQSLFNYPLLAIVIAIATAVVGFVYYCKTGDLVLFNYFIALICAFFAYIVISMILIVSAFLGEMCKIKFLRSKYNYLYGVRIDTVIHHKNPR